MSSSFRLPFDEVLSVDERIAERDRAARERAVDPRFNVALEASAGTGKTRVLVDRYVNLLRAGVDPANILAMTFTRKAAAEMRDRILATLRIAAERGGIPPARWRELRDRTGDINISTIDAFCLSLLREFPLEADLDPGFSMADEVEVPRLVDESLDRAMRICRAVARGDETVALVFAQLGERRARAGLAALLNRRIVASSVLERFLAHGSSRLTVDSVSADAARALLDVFNRMPGGLDRFIETGPPEPAFVLLARRLVELKRQIEAGAHQDAAAVHAGFAAVREHFLTQDGKARSRLTVARARFASADAWEAHRELVIGFAPEILRVSQDIRRELNVLVSRGVRRMFAIAESEYRRTLDAHAVLDFHDVLLKALQLLRQMEEFAQSRYRLEARYHHVLVDEFQDTSRAQWELVELLIASWGEGAGLAHSGPLQPTVFIVGDRKQSIYGFRDADVSVLREASRHLEALRPDGNVRRSISRSFRSVPALLAFVNDVSQAMGSATSRPDAFRYEEEDRFPVERSATEQEETLALVPGASPEECAELVAGEIARLIAARATVRDRDTGVRRPIGPRDIAILFRTRESHREYEEALAQRGISSYVYKGLGFFDADEIKDVVALLRYLADPTSDLRAAAYMRSGFGKVSDEGLRRLAPRLAAAVSSSVPTDSTLDPDDRETLEIARHSLLRWRGLVDRLPPAELLDVILRESAYARELRGARQSQARENLKKIRALIRRIQNRGYATMARIADHIDRLAIGDEPNAVIDALDAVNLMTIHAAKGLEFPVVFVVNMARGTGSRRDPIRVAGRVDRDAISVAVGDYRSEDDDDESAREREETKRLLYVALTRARDRVYLSSALKDGMLQPARGSLAEVMPSSLLGVFAEAAAGAAQVGWAAHGDAVHRFRVVSGERHDGIAGGERPQPPIVEGASKNTPGERPATQGDFGPVVDTAPVRRSVAAAVAPAHAPLTDSNGGSSSRQVGRQVHRLLQRFGVTRRVEDDTLINVLTQSLRGDERIDATDRELIDTVIGRFRAFRSRPDVRTLLESGDVHHEVPFTLSSDEGIVRGTIDCVVRRPDGSVHVVEFKTGRKRDEHLRQAELYRGAAAVIFPDSVVAADVLYAIEETGA